jgi:uncharacterized membrane protein YgdD (TMEM256/DUF423 family)
MPHLARAFTLIAGVSLMSAVMLSAYGFHGLPGKVPVEKIASWEWANEMQFYHSIGLILIGLFLARKPGSMLLKAAGGLMLIGLILFSAGIYAETLGAPAALGEVAPAGGGSFMLAWLLTGIAAYRMGE